MRWEGERYVRIFTRDTAEVLALGWEARSLFWEVLRKADRAGIVALGKTGTRGLAAVTGMPFDVVDRALAVLLEDGCVRRSDEGLVVPNFIAAQETPQSDKARQREKRERDRARAMDVTKRDPESQNVTAPSQNVTESHAPSRAVTPSHSVPCRAVPIRTVPDPPLIPPEGGETEQPGLPGVASKPKRAKSERKSPARAIPADWKPNEGHYQRGSQLGLDRGRVDAEVERFRDHHAAKGSVFASWDAALRTWLGNVPRFARAAAEGAPQPQPADGPLYKHTEF